MSNEQTSPAVWTFSSWAPAFVVAAGMSSGLLRGGWPASVVSTLSVAGALAGLFVFLFDPLLGPWRRSCRGPLFLPLSMAVCAFMVGWSLLGLTLPQMLDYIRLPKLSEPGPSLLKILDQVTTELTTQAGISWFLGLLACLWSRRNCGFGPAKASTSCRRVALALPCSLPVVMFSCWLLNLWWCGSSLDPELVAFCNRRGRPEAAARSYFLGAIDDIDDVDYEHDPDAPRPICAWAIREMPPLPDLLQWPKRAKVNAGWDRYRTAHLDPSTAGSISR